MNRTGSLSETKGNTGMVLVIVLVLLGIIAGLVFSLQLAVKNNLQEDETILRVIRFRAALTDTVLGVLRQLADDENLEVDHADEDWAQSHERLLPSGISVWTKTTDLNRFLDVNNISIEEMEETGAGQILMDLMTLCQDFSPVERVQALQDWVDTDSEGFRELAWYMDKANPYRPANTYLDTWSELSLIEGFDRDYMNRTRPYGGANSFRGSFQDSVTVIPHVRTSPIRVNINTAPSEVLQGLAGLGNETWVRNIVTKREAEPIQSLNEVMAGMDSALTATVQPYLATRSYFFQVQARAFSGSHSESLLATVYRDAAGDIKILQWVY